VLNYAQSLDKADAPEEDMELGKQFAQTVTYNVRDNTTRRPLRRWQQWWPLALFICSRWRCTMALAHLAAGTA
jgi:hypothetical protein